LIAQMPEADPREIRTTPRNREAARKNRICSQARFHGPDPPYIVYAWRGRRFPSAGRRRRNDEDVAGGSDLRLELQMPGMDPRQIRTSPGKQEAAWRNHRPDPLRFRRVAGSIQPATGRFHPSGRRIRRVIGRRNRLASTSGELLDASNGCRTHPTLRVMHPAGRWTERPAHFRVQRALGRIQRFG
jgi:hypothetical protein